MNDELRQRVIQALQRGEDLPSDWARELFPPEKREYELVYYGKERAEDIIAGTMAVPLQAERTFGKNGVDWHNMLIFGDNLQVMKTLLEQKKAGKLCNADGTPGVRLIYIDPPFATKQEFRGSQDQKAYQDKLAGAHFVEFTKNVQDAPPLAVGRNERSWGWARCPRQDAVESVLGFQVLKAPPLAAG